jgi:hypothetical protein
LVGRTANGGPIKTGSQPFPHQCVFPSGKVCRDFDQLALACQENWTETRELLQQGFGTSSRNRWFFLGLERLRRQAKNASFLAKNASATSIT